MVDRIKCNHKNRYIGTCLGYSAQQFKSQTMNETVNFKKTVLSDGTLKALIRY